MTYSTTLRRALDNIILVSESVNMGPGIEPDRINYTNHTVHNLIMPINISSPSMEFPAYLRNLYEVNAINRLRTLATSTGGSNSSVYDEIAVFMYEGRITHKKTADSVLKSMFTETPAAYRLTKVTTNKDEVYYGCKGIIMDANKRVLFMVTFNEEPFENSLKLTGVNLYINPSVFLNDDLISKAIVKKIIPFYIENEYIVFAPSNIFNEFNSVERDRVPRKVKIILEDPTDKFFRAPSVPTPSSMNPEQINEFLLGYCDEMTNSLRI